MTYTTPLYDRRIANKRDNSMNKRVHIGILAFPDVLQMDLTGPYGVFAAASDARVDLIWKNTTPFCSSDGLVFQPTLSFADCGQLDIICIPGGSGIVPLLSDAETLSFLRVQAAGAQYLCSVCTGALVLAAAGLLDEYRVTTHWQAKELLAEFDVVVADQRVVVDRNRVTAAGVTSGIDMALVLVGLLWGDDQARTIELNMEYSPEPPFKSGNPHIAPANIVTALQHKNADRQKARMQAVKAAVGRLKAQPDNPVR